MKSLFLFDRRVVELQEVSGINARVRLDNGRIVTTVFSLLSTVSRPTIPLNLYSFNGGNHGTPE